MKTNDGGFNTGEYNAIVKANNEMHIFPEERIIDFENVVMTSNYLSHSLKFNAVRQLSELFRGKEYIFALDDERFRELLQEHKISDGELLYFADNHPDAITLFYKGYTRPGEIYD